MGRVEGKVAFITGAARGQGRAHAIRLAEEGADIIAMDLCAELPGMVYDGPTSADLDETARLVEALGRRAVVRKGDVRDVAGMTRILEEGVAELGRLDIVVANAGLATVPTPAEEIPDSLFDDVIAVNLSGVWRTAKAAIPFIRAAGNGGSIAIISSTGGLRGFAGLANYNSAKHGLSGLMKVLALELGPEWIRVNTVHPTQVDTPMMMNDSSYRVFVPGVEHPTKEQFAAASMGAMALPIPWVESIDVANAVLFLASDEARYITGASLAVDAGAGIK
ncbi:MAG: 3-ketoacyl-ACP reductase [Microbacteriaceae bacterium]|nr:3-ketoacyl-ACP reductase [Microbacteriaceae bacterium]